MNTEYAVTVPLCQILGKLGLEPIQEKNNLLIYASPFDREGKSILNVDTKRNTWTDNFLNTGGNTLGFVREHLQRSGENCSSVDVLQWLAFNIGYLSLSDSISLPDYGEMDKQYTFSYKSSHFSVFNLRYLASRRIPAKLAKRHLKEVAYINTENNNESLALGLKNEEGGYALRSLHIKAIIGPRSISIIKGRAEKKTAIHVFKDIYDYLSAVFVQKGKPFNNDAIILNSYSCLEDSARYIRSMDYRGVYTWLDNGNTGKQATKKYEAFSNALENTRHKPMNNLYASAYDVNAWLIMQAEKAGR